ncbi:MAG: hypothetical protein M1831_004213 [Alyxoria varia]|nr:MAG: hypothetical protein M1831_004213 [Alyxoria varia]
MAGWSSGMIPASGIISTPKYPVFGPPNTRLQEAPRSNRESEAWKMVDAEQSTSVKSLLAHLGEQSRAIVARNASESLKSLSLDEDGLRLASVVCSLLDFDASSIREDLARPFDDAFESLVGYAKRFICNCKETVQIRSLVKVLGTSTCITENLLGIVKSCILRTANWIADNVSERAFKSGIAGAADVTKRKNLEFLDDDIVDNDLDVIRVLQFTQLLIQEHGQPWDMQHFAAFFPSLLLLIGSLDHELAAIAYETISTLIQNIPNSKALGYTRLPDYLDTWHIIHWLVQNTEEEQCNYGMSVWLTLASSESMGFPSKDVLDQHIYFETIRTILARGSYEQKKYAIALFQLANSEFNSETAAAHVTFTNIYETIVFGRAIDHIQETLPDLSSLASGMSLVHSKWLLALLEACLSHDVQDSIRKVVGRWTMQRGSTMILGGDAQGVEFLKNVFLPWASQGYLFNNSVVVDENLEPTCVHGEILSRFLRIVLEDCRTETQYESLVLAVMDFIDTSRQRIYPWGRVHVLDGLFRGSMERPSELISVIKSHKDLATRLARQEGFQELSNDLMRLQTARLLDILDIQFGARDMEGSRDDLDLLNSAVGGFDREVSQTSLALEKLPLNSSMTPERATQGIDESTHPHPLQRLHHWITTNRRSIRGDGLMAALTYANFVLNDAKEISFDPVPCYIGILEALSFEIDAQDNPRRPLLEFTQIVLHSCIVCHASADSQLSSLLDSCLRQMLELSRTRFYVFTSLMQELRQLVRNRADLATHLPLKDVITSIAKSPPEMQVEFQLDRAISKRLESYDSSKTFESYYGKGHAFGLACLFDLINSFARNTAYAQLAQEIVGDLIAPWLKQKDPVPVFSPWKSLLQLQVILIFSLSFIPTLSNEHVNLYLDKFLKLLEKEQNPHYRFLIEWIIIRLHVHHPSYLWQTLDRIKNSDESSNPKLTVSHIRIAVSLARLPSSSTSYVQTLVRRLAVLATSPKVAVRHEAQWSHPALHELAKSRDWGPVILGNEVFVEMTDYFMSQKSYKEPPKGRLTLGFRPSEDHNLSYLVQGSWLWTLQPSVAPALRREDFVEVYRDDEKRLKEGKNEDSGDVTVQSSEVQNPMPLGPPQPSPQLQTATPSDPTADDPSQHIPKPLQTKPSLLRPTLASPQTSSRSTHPPRPTQLTLIATLVTSPYNLGGLSRACETLGAGCLYVDALEKTLESKDFATTSMTSHKHLPIKELRVPEVREFLIGKKAEGWEVVGVEQTDRSRILGGGGGGGGGGADLKDDRVGGGVDGGHVDIGGGPSYGHENVAGAATSSGADTDRKCEGPTVVQKANSDAGNTITSSTDKPDASDKTTTITTSNNKPPAHFHNPCTILLLGSERKGIPGDLLGVCDWCVEIPQRGFTRSMNVQTAAAVVMFEFGRQRGGGRG